MATDKPSKRTRQALKAIEDAVFSLLAEKEFESVTAQEIYRRANVNKMTFYKYHNNKYDALAKAFTSRVNEEFDSEIAHWVGEQRNLDTEEANYLGLMFTADFIERYHIQFSHLVSAAGDLPKDVVFSALFANYRPYFAYVTGQELNATNEYLVHFAFGALRSICECQMQHLAKNPASGAPKQDVQKACRIIAKSFSLLLNTLREGENTQNSDSAA